MVYDFREKVGETILKSIKKQDIDDIDIIVPIPMTSIISATTIANKLNKPLKYAVLKNRYTHRTFINKDNDILENIRKIKIVSKLVENKNILLVDDSIVRGTTARKIVRMIYDAGAAEVHFGISCPPITHPDFYGIDTPDYDELIASKNTIKEMKESIGATSLFFLSLDGTYKAMGHDKRDNNTPQFTDHCFTGDYPTPLLDHDQGTVSKQYSLLTEKN